MSWDNAILSKEGNELSFASFINFVSFHLLHATSIADTILSWKSCATQTGTGGGWARQIKLWTTLLDLIVKGHQTQNKNKTKKNLKSALLHQIVGGHQTHKRPNAEAEFRGDLLLKLVRPICTRKVLWINQVIAAWPSHNLFPERLLFNFWKFTFCTLFILICCFHLFSHVCDKGFIRHP